MTGDQFRELIDRLDWSGHLMAELLGRDARLVRHWLSGVRPIPTDMAEWLWRLDALWATLPKSRRATQVESGEAPGPVEGFSR